MVKKLAGQGLLYIHVKQAMQFSVNETAEIIGDSDEDTLPSIGLNTSTKLPSTRTDSNIAPDDPSLTPDGPSVTKKPR